ncbi:MAG: hypothetical protein EZS28_018035 [Streblomastix strix]|uniref:Calcineurin-like phosphoesterase domain-containing protein n=1 Tax=Streblomastix strix TaxID=222440 RepID=A0A5J4VV58_9EUKA|nr:MAG: hypothetical protein EZS28_018035 [Streblomastix strix]
MDEVVYNLIKPFVVINSGDNVVAHQGYKSVNATSEWLLYQKAIYRPEWKPCEYIVDVRGNHDTYGITQFFADDNPFIKYSSFPDPGLDLPFSFFGGFNNKKTKSYPNV